MNNIYDDTMNNNEPDYEGNLAFPPQEESVEKKCEKLEKQLKIAVNGINESIKDYEINGECYEDCVGFYMNATLIKTLEQIKDLDK